MLFKFQFLLMRMLSSETVGGGEILGVLGSEDESIPGISERAYWFMTHLNTILIVTAAILIGVGFYAVMSIMGTFNAKGIDKILDGELSFGKVDKKQRRARKFIWFAERLQEKGILKMDRYKAEDLDFNLRRIGMKIRDVDVTPGAYNGIKWMARFVVILLSVLLTLLIGNTGLLFIGLVGLFLISSVDLLIEAKIRKLDEEIYAGFLEFYLMLHHTMISDGGATLTSLIKLYNQTATGEMKRVSEQILYHFDTYGESMGCDRLTNAFRHEYVTRLMRLIKGYVRGADVRDDMKGFRSLLIENRERDIIKASEKLQMKARASFYILMPVLVQAIISAMAIYFGDIMQVTSFM